MVNGDLRSDMLQEITRLLQKLTEEAPDIYYFTRLIDTGIGRIEIFCEHPATFPPDSPIGKHSEDKAPARSIIVSVLRCLQSTIQKTYNSWYMVKCGLILTRKNFRKFVWEKDTRIYLPTGVGTGSLIEKVSGDFVRI